MCNQPGTTIPLPHGLLARPDDPDSLAAAALRRRMTLVLAFSSCCSSLAAARSTTTKVSVPVTRQRHGFAELHRRGERQVWLHVDAENRTGATRLYERAGMRVEHRLDCWVKRLA